MIKKRNENNRPKKAKFLHFKHWNETSNPTDFKRLAFCLQNICVLESFELFFMP